MEKVKVVTLTRIQAISLQQMLAQDAGVATAYYLREFSYGGVSLEEQVAIFLDLENLLKDIDFTIEVGLRSTEKLLDSGYNMDELSMSLIFEPDQVDFLTGVVAKFRPVTTNLSSAELLNDPEGVRRLFTDLALVDQRAALRFALDNAREYSDRKSLTTDATETLAYLLDSPGEVVFAEFVEAKS
jgi:hypothetical protein